MASHDIVKTSMPAADRSRGLTSSSGLEEAQVLWVIATVATVSFLAILLTFAKSFLVGLFSRIRKESILDNPMRSKIVEAIQQSQGIHFQALSRETGSARGALEHHLRKLEAAGVVTHQVAGGYTSYFTKEAPVSTKTEAAWTRSRMAQQVLQAARTKPTLNGQALAKELGVVPSTIHYHQQRLRKAGLL